jgi:hypothetical protein
MMRVIVRQSMTLCGALLLLATQLMAQEEKPAHVEGLAKQTQNPVADLVSIPFQFNFNTGGGLEDGTLFNLNLQPVFPISVSKDWNIIFRTIIPFLSSPTPSGDQVGGIGDIQIQLFASPVNSGKLIWGVGPQFSVPTATNPLFRTGSWAVGPTAVVLTMPGHWVLGLLANQVWTFADNGGTDVDQLLIQPFINYNFGRGWAISSGPIITANWEAGDGQEWTVPLGAGISRTTIFNRRAMVLGAQYYYNVVHPDAGPASQFRIFISLLYPSAHKPEEKK